MSVDREGRPQIASREVMLELAAALARRCYSASRAGGASAPLLQQSSALLESAPRLLVHETASRPLPVARFLPQTSELASLPSADQDALRHLLAAEPDLAWRQNPNYTPQSIGPDFLDGYGYLELAGPTGYWVTGALRIGFLLIGPRRLYPPHQHPAEEVYLPVVGTAEWWRADGDWQTVSPGRAIHHPSNLEHATRTQAQALLALYLWAGAVAIEARLTRHL